MTSKAGLTLLDLVRLSYHAGLLIGIDELDIETLLIKEKSDIFIIKGFPGLRFYHNPQSEGS